LKCRHQDLFAEHSGSGGGLSRKAVLVQVDACLTRLDVECVDLLQIHRFDPETPVEETMQALHDVVKAGKVRYLSASSMWAWRFSKMQHAAETHGWNRGRSGPRGGRPAPGEGNQRTDGASRAAATAASSLVGGWPRICSRSPVCSSKAPVRITGPRPSMATIPSSRSSSR
jgi:Aldo/keto reductase family